MGGGSLDYVFHRIEDAAQSIVSQSKIPLHSAFAKHLLKVSKALHDLEWVLSGDYSISDEVDAIRAVISPVEELNSAREDAEVALKNLEQAINNASKIQ